MLFRKSAYESAKPFIRLGKNGVSSLAVVNQMGTLLGNISMTDVKVCSTFDALSTSY